MDVQRAVAMPHLLNRFGLCDIEAGTSAEALSAPLVARGFEVDVGDQPLACIPLP
jgi:gamma-glutamyltranspeptidase/glutathione hydrolase